MATRVVAQKKSGSVTTLFWLIVLGATLGIVGTIQMMRQDPTQWHVLIPVIPLQAFGVRSAYLVTKQEHPDTLVLMGFLALFICIGTILM